jgi:hypothetical protein
MIAVVENDGTSSDPCLRIRIACNNLWQCDVQLRWAVNIVDHHHRECLLCLNRDR